MAERNDVSGPYIVWENHGYEGWRPKSYDDLAEALTTPRYCSEWEITKKIILEVLSDGKVLVR